MVKKVLHSIIGVSVCMIRSRVILHGALCNLRRGDTPCWPGVFTTILLLSVRLFVLHSLSLLWCDPARAPPPSPRVCPLLSGMRGRRW